MAIKVNNLTIKLQSGTTNTLYASWGFNTSSSSTTMTSTSIKAGTIVKVKKGAVYYNSTTVVPEFVTSRQWIVLSAGTKDRPTRIVIDKSTDGQYSICSPIDAKYLEIVSGGSSTSNTSVTTVSNFDHYEVKWHYYTDGDKWFSASSSDTKDKNSIYSSVPSNATKVKVTVKPVSKTYEKNGKSQSYWTGTAVTVYYTMYEGKPEQTSAPSIAVDKFKMTATLNDIVDVKADKIEFYVVKGNSKYTSGIVEVKTNRAIFTCDLTSGGKYRVKCRAVNTITNNTKVYGDWSAYCSEFTTIPSQVSNLKCFVDSKTSVKLTWNAVSDAVEYEVSYTTDKRYFDTASGVSTLTVVGTTAFVTQLDSGDEWFFRVRAKNNQGESIWSSIVSTVIGTTPEPPTTWSLITSATVGESVRLFWVHNSEDGSKQTAAEVEVSVNGIVNTHSVPTYTPDDEEELTYYVDITTDDYTEGAKILWRVRTKGITDNFSDWSMQREIDIYAPATLGMSLDTDYTDGILNMFPLTVTLFASPSTQIPVGYHISVVATEDHEIVNFKGETTIVTAGQEIYSKVFSQKYVPVSIQLSAKDISLTHGQTYEIVATVSMDSGLSATNRSTFTVEWAEESYHPDASIAIDDNSYSAYITPFCVDDDGYYIPDVLLSVYRVSHMGEFVEIATDIQNNGYTSVTDPHPSLDYARYRIVAMKKDTNVVSFSDLPGVVINEPAVIIQWDEKWTSLDDTSEEVAPEIESWTGSLLRLPYNVTISEKHDIDVSLVEYIGRKHPVVYYGTQLGESSSINTDIPKSDNETIAALRRLSAWCGDVYIREPSGAGYWAQVSVSLSFNRKELVVPVTIEAKRVEGSGI